MTQAHEGLPNAQLFNNLGDDRYLKLDGSNANSNINIGSYDFTTSGALNTDTYNANDGTNLFEWDSTNNLLKFLRNITLENGEYITNATDGHIRLVGVGGTYNQWIDFDLSSQWFGCDITTSLGNLRFSASPLIGDDVDFIFGSASDVRLRWTTSGNDHLQLTIPVGTSAQSGNWVIATKGGDYGHPVNSNPTIYLHSATGPETATDEWISFQHNQIDAKIETGTGDLILEPAGSVVINTLNTNTYNAHDGTNLFEWDSANNRIKFFKDIYATAKDITFTGIGSFGTLHVAGQGVINYSGLFQQHLYLKGMNGTTPPTSYRGGSLSFYKDKDNIAGYVYANSNGDLVFDTTPQATHIDTGNARINFETGDITGAAITGTSLTDGTLSISGGEISSANALNLKLSNDNDDYLVIRTVNNAPEITTAGNSQLKINSDYGRVISDADWSFDPDNIRETYFPSIYNKRIGLFRGHKTSATGTYESEMGLAFATVGNAATRYLYGFFGYTIADATHDSNHIDLAGGLGSAYLPAGYTGTTTQVIGLWGYSTIYGGTATNAIGVKGGVLVDDATATNVYLFKGDRVITNYPTIRNAYGLYIPNINFGSNLNYAIYSEGGDVELTDGNLTTTGTGSFGSALIGDGGTTNYTEIKDDGEINLHGTARVLRDLWIDVSGIKAPGAKPATEVSHGNLETAAWQFSNEGVEANQESVSWRIAPPYDMDRTEGVKIRVGWSSASTGNVKWQLEYRWLSEDEDTTQGAEETLTVVDAASTTANGLVVTDITGINAPSATDASIIFRLTRLSADAQDTISDTVELHGICFNYVSDKLGEAI